MAPGMFKVLDPLVFTISNIRQDIAPTYYDVNSFPKGDIRSSLMRAADRLARKQKMREEKRR